MSPLVAFVIVFALLMVALIKFKVTPSVGLFVAAIVFGLMAGMPMADVMAKIPAGFGSIMASLGLVLIFGSIFGDFLGESGATEELAKGMLRNFGRKHDILALNLVGFILSIPIYFGVAYIMTAPLVKAIQKVTKKSMKSYVIAIFTGLMLTHCCVAPTPGPLAVAGQIGANIGWFIIYGIIICLPASLLIGVGYAKFVGRKDNMAQLHADIKEIVDNDELLAHDPTKPTAITALLLVCLPIFLIVLASVWSLFSTEGILYTIVSFIGNQNVALFISVIVSGIVLKRYMPNKTIMGFIDEAADRSGGIVLIVGAGGCFSAMLSATTMSTDLVALMSAAHMPIILLGFILAFAIRAAVGSGTAAMLAAVAIAGPACVETGLSPVVAGMSICLGATAGTLPTDVTFWFPERMNDLSSKDCTLTTFVPSLLAALVGFVILLIINACSGFLPGLY